MQTLPANEKDAYPWPGRASFTENTSFEVRGGYLNFSTKSPILDNQFFPISKEGLNKVEHVSRRGAGDLVDITRNVSADRRYGKYHLLRDVVKVLQGSNMRVQYCMRASKANVDVIKGEDGHVHARGVWVCKSVWVCPVCSRRMAEQRRAVLLQAVQASGLYPVMATLTVQHGRMDPLKELTREVKASWREVKTGREWGSFQARHGVMHYITSMEVRASIMRGWHPHLHVLFLCDKEVDPKAFREELTAIYTRKVAKNGGYASEFHAIHVTVGDAGLASYCQKWDYASELLRGGSKEGRKEGSYSVWDLAQMGSDGNEWAVRMFKEYASGTFGRRQITYSRGAKEELGITDDPVKVEENSEQGNSPQVIISIDRRTWGVVHRRGVVGEVLLLADVAGEKAVRMFLQGLPAPGERLGVT